MYHLVWLRSEFSSTAHGAIFRNYFYQTLAFLLKVEIKFTDLLQRNFT